MENGNGALATIETGQVVQALTAQALLNRVERIREVQSKVMKDGVDYGTIQGCGDKPTLLKPGAETLLLAFEMAALPDQMTIQDLGDSDEVRYRVITPIVHVPTGRLCGNGVGECSSMEEKYKWRKAVCDEEFHEADPDRRRVKWAKSRDGVYQVNQIRTNKADVANTVLKMAKKRSLVDGALTVTAASRVFTQDVEDLPEELRGEGHAQQAKPREQPKNQPHVPNYGKYAGKGFSEVPTDGEGGLRDYLSGVERSIDDPKKDRFKKKNMEMRDALKAEIARREQPAEQPAQPGAPAPSDAHPKDASGPVTGGTAAGEQPGYDAEWLSKVLDCEDYLRQTQAGKNLLRGIREGFKLQGDAYPMLSEEQAEYLTTLQRTVERLGKTQ